jgi:outer membrane protein assembly factor BamB
VLLAALLTATVARGAIPPDPGPRKPPKPATQTTTTPTDGEWLAYGADDQLTNHVTSAAIDARSAPTLGLRWAGTLDGWMAASPVAAPVDGAMVVYAATEGGSVFAFDAAKGTVLWQRYLGIVETAGDCGTWGISSTPAIDVQRGLLYVIGATGLLHALDLKTGEEAAGFPLQITFERNRVEYVWGGLRMVGDRLFLVVASYCDKPDDAGIAAEGRIVAVDLTTRAVTNVWDPVPGPGNLGSIWGYGGLSVEPDGTSLYTGVGNASVRDEKGTLVDDAGYGDKLVKLDATSFEVLGSDLPAGILTNGADEDFGAAPVLFQPKGCPPLAAMNNKQGYLYIWNRLAIDEGPLIRVGVSDGAAPFIGQPAWSPQASRLYDAEAKSTTEGMTGVVAIAIDGACHQKVVWETLIGAPPQPPPIVVNNVVFAAGGSAGISAMDAADGSLLWRVNTGSPALAPPIEVAGTVYASGGERLLAFSPK